MSRSGWLGCLSLLMGLAACGGEATDPDPAGNEEPPSIIYLRGDGQTAPAGGRLPQPLAVLVRKHNGTALPGVSVSWATGSGGSFEANTTPTDADGLASTRWTLGQTTGQQTATASLGEAGAQVVFTATATALPPNPPVIALTSGNGQTRQAGTALAEPLVVTVSDADGNGLQGLSVAWATADGGSLSASATTTDAEGRTSVTWTLGNNAGQQSATASLAGASGSPVTFTATAVDDTPGSVVVAGVNPSPLIEGQQATILGTGFGTSAGATSVTLEGVNLTVTQVTQTAVSVSIPVSNCKPARTGDLRVTVSGVSSNVFPALIAPSEFFDADVGGHSLLQDPASFCLQFSANQGSEDYLIGVQSTSEVSSSLTPVTLTGTAAGAAVSPLPPPGANMVSVANGIAAGDPNRERRWNAHREAELERRHREREMLSRILGRATVRREAFERPRLVAPPQVGDVISRTVPDLNGPLCTGFQVNAIVRAVGTRGIWLEDLDNPVGGYSTADFEAMSGMFDGLIYQTDVEHFGEPTDLDGTGHIYILITKEVNQSTTTLGFVAADDLLPKSICPTSNEGEIYYGLAPDPTGIHPFGPYAVARGLTDSPTLIAHEFTHIIQVSRRLVIAGGGLDDLMAVWTAEGQATLAEEIVGFVAEGRAVGQNLGFAVAFNQDDPSSTDWYSDRFFDLAFYYGWQLTTMKVPGAPAECSWLDNAPGNAGPCLGGRAVYGVSWSLLRWMSDRFGPAFPGGEAGLQQALINSTEVGYANLATVVGIPIETILARWAAALYVDDRVDGAAPALTIPSWNLLDIESNVTPSARLTPTSRGFGAFTESVSVRAGSTAYFRVSGAGRPATSVRVRGAADATLPSNMQVFVVRLR